MEVRKARLNAGFDTSVENPGDPEAGAVVKIQFELPAERVKEIDALMHLTEITTRKDYFNNALTLLEWAIHERYLGNAIASVDEQKKRFKELVMPILNNAANAAK